MSRSLASIIFSIKNTRGFYTNATLRCPKSTSSSSSSSTQGDNGNKTILGSNMHRPSNYDKIILVLARKYPSMKDVPKHVSLDIMQHSMSKVRIRFANILIIGTLITCLTIITSGNKKKDKLLASMQDEHDDIRREIMAEYKAGMTEGTKGK